MSTKRALCVGINDYPGTGSDLRGCVNDAKDWKEVLEGRGYEVETIFDSKATAKNLREGLTRLLQDAVAGDSLAFTFSGHGSWLPDTNGDEVDGRDEMICPHDISDNKYLLDDELAAIFGRKPAGVNLFFISDSCHSGSVSRFNAPLFPAAAGAHPLPRFLPPATFLKSSSEIRAADVASRYPATSLQRYPALLFAGCKDIEYSYDAYIDGRPNGAFTRTAIKALEKNPKTPSAWMKQIQEHLPTSIWPQSPQLYGSSKAKSGPMI